MTLDEAIKRAEEVIVESLEKTEGRNASDPIAIKCGERAEEHRQLAEWLKDYKRLLEQKPCNDIEELEAIKAEILKKVWRDAQGQIVTRDGFNHGIIAATDIIDKHISELKGE